MTAIGYCLCALLLGGLGYFAAESISAYYRERRRRTVMDRLNPQTWPRRSGPSEWR